MTRRAAFFSVNCKLLLVVCVCFCVVVFRLHRSFPRHYHFLSALNTHGS